MATAGITIGRIKVGLAAACLGIGVLAVILGLSIPGITACAGRGNNF